MKSVMWVQAFNPGEDDFVFVDGGLIPAGSSSLRDECTKILFHAQDAKYIRFKEIERLRLDSGSPNIAVAQNPTMGLLYKSLFNERDPNGREMTFVLWCDNEERQNYWEIAQNNAAQLHCTLREIEHNLVDKYLERIKKKRALFLCGVVLVLIISLIIAL